MNGVAEAVAKAAIHGMTSRLDGPAATAADAASATEDRWDYSHHQAFVGGMYQEAHMRNPPGGSKATSRAGSLGGFVITSVAQGFGQKLGFAAADGAIQGASKALQGIVDTWRWMFPLSPEELLRQAQFSRCRIDRFMQKAILDNKTFIVIQPHRISPEVRSGLEADGYKVKLSEVDGRPAIEVHFVKPSPSKDA